MLEEQSWTHKLLLTLALVDTLQVVKCQLKVGSINAEPLCCIKHIVYLFILFFLIYILECIPPRWVGIRKTERKFLICCVDCQQYQEECLDVYTVISSVYLISFSFLTWFSGYSGDVWNPQPAPKDHPWRYMPNQAMTPHVSGTTIDAQVIAFFSPYSCASLFHFFLTNRILNWNTAATLCCGSQGYAWQILQGRRFSCSKLHSEGGGAGTSISIISRVKRLIVWVYSLLNRTFWNNPMFVPSGIMFLCL